MIDREKVIKGLECLAQKQAPTANPCKDCGYINRPSFAICVKDIASDALDLLKEQEQTINALESDLKETLEELASKEKDSMLGMKMTADGITFTAKGDAKQGEQRGLLLGKTMMHEHIEKELLYEKLLTDEVRAVLDRVKRRLISDS